MTVPMWSVRARMTVASSSLMATRRSSRIWAMWRLSQIRTSSIELLGITRLSCRRIICLWKLLWSIIPPRPRTVTTLAKLMPRLLSASMESGSTHVPSMASISILRRNSNRLTMLEWRPCSTRLKFMNMTDQASSSEFSLLLLQCQVVKDKEDWVWPSLGLHSRRDPLRLK